MSKKLGDWKKCLTKLKKWKCGWLNWKVVVKLRNHTQIGEKIDSLSMKYNIKYTVHHLI